MELTLNVGDNINIPENCEVVVKDNTLTIKEKPRNFKDGDILVVKDNSSFIVIFKEYDKLNKETFISYFNNQGLSNTNWSSPCFRKATEEEKQNFLNGLEERGLKWDPTVKEIIKIRERFKNGDILISRYHNRFVIFSHYTHSDESLFDSYFNSTNNSNSAWVTKNFRLATDEEKRAFSTMLELDGLHWNAKTKTIEKIRVRVKNGGRYLTINESGKVVELYDDRSTFDTRKYNLGNYYLPEEREQAEEDAKIIKAIYENRIKL